MLRPVSTLHQELEEDRWRGVEIKTTKNTGRWVSVLHYRARQEEGWHGVEPKKTRNSQRHNRLYHTRRDRDDWRGFHKSRQEEEDGHGYHKAPQEGKNRHRSRREEENRHGYHKTRQGGADRQGYHKVRREEKDQHGYRKAQQDGEDRQEEGWHGVKTTKTRNAQRHNRLYHTRRDRDDWHGFHKSRQEEEDGHGYHKAPQEGKNRYRSRREEEDHHRYHKTRREEEDHHGYHKTRQGGADQQGYHKVRREEKDQHGYRKAQQDGEDRQEEGWHGVKTTKTRNAQRHNRLYHTRRDRDDCHGFHMSRQEEEDGHGYHKAPQEGKNRYRSRREEEDHHRYHKTRREEEDHHGYHKTRQGGADRHGYHKARQEEKDWHGYRKAQQGENRHGYYKARQEVEDKHDFKNKKTKTISKPMNAVHRKAHLQEKKHHGSEIKKTQDTSETINGLYHKAHYEKNKSQDDIVALVALLKACAKDKDLHRGSIIHSDIITRGLLENNVFIGSALVNMYGKCGAIEKAQEVFDKLPVHNVVSWTTLIAAYAQNGQVKEAFSCFELMQLKGFFPDAFTFACVLRACTSVEAFDKGMAIHSMIVREYPLMEENTHVGTVLVDMYAKCGALEQAQEAFNKLPVQDVVSWTALIAGYAQHEQGEEALINFEQMQHEGFFPDAFTFACILKACGSTRATRKGQSIHAQIVRHGLLENNMFISTALVDMYANCGMLAEAQASFDNLRIRDLVSWSVLIGGYAQHGHGDKALKCFEQMQHDGFTPDVVTLTCILKVCGSIGALNKGQEIYAHIVREQMSVDTHIGTVLVDMYAKCGALEKAKEVFGKLEVKDVILWTALIAGYMLHGHGEEALGSFEQMQSEGFYPDAVTYASILKACGNIGAVHRGQKLHAEIVRHGLLKNGASVGTALVDMYANLGMFAEAQEVFDKLAVRDLFSWSVLIAGYAQLGKDKFVFSLFDKMIQEGKQPDPVTFIAVLNTCSHKGLVDKGQFYFELISKDFSMFPIIEHHTCIIDLFGRAGHLDNAVAVIEVMSFSANLTLWHTFLGACQKWGNMKLGSWASEHAQQLKDINAAPHVALRNIYSDAGHVDIGGNDESQKSKHTWTYLGV